MEKEKKGLQLKLKETESLLEKRPQTSETSKTIMELQTKLKYLARWLYNFLTLPLMLAHNNYLMCPWNVLVFH